MEIQEIQNVEQMRAKVAELNASVAGLGMLPLALVSPKDCIGQKKNARYMGTDTMEQLTQNIKGDGALESVPLLFQDEKLEKEGKYEIISGHHRIEAAKAAGLQLIMCFVRKGITRDQLVSKQLSHNSLTGKDDQQLLKELFDSITDIDLKMASGLSNEIAKVEFESLNFKMGTYKSFMILFTPPQIDDFEKIVKDVVANSNMGGSETEVRLASMDDSQAFIAAIQRVKKVENIKSNAVAIHRILQLAAGGLVQLEKEKEARDAERKLEQGDKKTKGKKGTVENE
jgi:hypothetical protein